jgi:AhpD family alkylhydroperoxidase
MTAKERIADVKQLMENLKQDYPAEINSFLGFMGKAEGNPALSAVQKELINVALSVAAQCEWCIALHTKNAIEAGASRDEIMSAGFMAIIMHGGPALMYLVPLSKALDEFLPEDHHG